MRVSCVLLICIFDFHLISMVFPCSDTEFEVEDVFRKVSCKPCPSCPPGTGLTPQCGTFVKYGVFIECKPCKLGETYSSGYSIDSCQPCGICVDHQKAIRTCTLESNSKCNRSCSSGFYYEDMTDDCQPCSFCCIDGRNTVKDGCKDMPFFKQCDANEISCELDYGCQDNQYVVITRKGPHCELCKNCPAGSSLSPPCGSIVENTNYDIKCVECIAGKTFSEKPDVQQCKPCSVCPVLQKELRPCTLTHDRLCGMCDKGFYNVSGSECKPCSACCGDDKDVRVPQCIRQNMPKHQQCSYTKRAINVCQQNNAQHGSNTTTQLVVTTIGVIIALIVGLALWKNSKYRKYRHISSPRSQSLAALLPFSDEAVREEWDAQLRPIPPSQDHTSSFVKPTDWNKLPNHIRPYSEDVYPMSARPLGIALIINNNDFCPDLDKKEELPPLPVREGSERDVKALERLFEALDFSVKTERNIGRQKILEILDCVAHEDHRGYDCFVLWLMSHGKDGQIYGADGETVPIETCRSIILDYFSLSYYLYFRQTYTKINFKF